VISESKWRAMRGEVESRPARWRAKTPWLGISAAAVLIFAALPLHAQTKTAQAGADPSAIKLADVPPALLPAISSTLGHDDARYGIQATADGYSSQNAANHLAARYKADGVEIRSQNSNWGFEFQGWGYGEHPANKNQSAVSPSVNANRVEYRRGALTEWYVNGPLGIEQGFTISQPPVALPNSNHASLDIALRLRGNLSAFVDPGRHALVLRDQNGAPALRYGPLLAYDASGRELDSWMEVQDGGLRLRVNTTGARYPILVDPWVQVAELTNSSGLAGDALGRAIAIDEAGDTVVVGAPYAEINGQAAQGAAYVFVEPTNGNGWASAGNYTAVLTNNSGLAGDNFGWSVAISGNTIVVGSPSATNMNQGAAYVFVEPTTAGGWADQPSEHETAELTPSTRALDDLFGYSVGISGSTLVVGAAQGNTGLGAAYVFVESTWSGSVTSNIELTASDGAAGDSFGSSVGINESGNIVVVGAPQGSTGPGAVYVFVEPNGGPWAATSRFSAKLTTLNGVTGDDFGQSASINETGDTVVAGAPNLEIGSNIGQGAAYVFVEPTTAGGWADQPSENETAELTASSGSTSTALGYSVRISGNTVVAGATGVTIASKLAAGAAYVFVEPTTAGGWADQPSEHETAELTASNGVPQTFLGLSVGIGGNTVVAGAPGINFGSDSVPGAAYVFTSGTTGPTSAISATSGSGQTASVNAAFSAPLEATVVNGSGTGVSGVTVTFTAPANGASGTFSGGVDTAVTDASGMAISPIFTANATAGSYNVTASAPNVTGTASFSLTNQATAITTKTTINSTTSTSKLGFSFPSNTALVDGSPVTVSFTVQQASGSTTPTGTVVVTDGFGDTCTTTTLNSGAGTCTIPMITQFGTGATAGTTPLNAAYTPFANSMFLASSTLTAVPPTSVTETLVEMYSPCTNAGTTHSKPTPIQQQTVTTVCLAGNIGVVPTVAWETDCMPHEKCSVTVSPETPGAPDYTITLTSIATDAGVKGSLPNAPPRRGPWMLTIFEFVALLSILMALRLTRQHRTRLRLSCAAGLLCVLVLGGMSSCGGPAGAPPGNYTVDLTITAGQFQLVVPVTVAVPK
jgi:hypothetical protein